MGWIGSKGWTWREEEGYAVGTQVRHLKTHGRVRDADWHVTGQPCNRKTQFQFNSASWRLKVSRVRTHVHFLWFPRTSGVKFYNFSSQPFPFHLSCTKTKKTSKASVFSPSIISKTREEKTPTIFKSLKT